MTQKMRNNITQVLIIKIEVCIGHIGLLPLSHFHVHRKKEGVLGGIMQTINLRFIRCQKLFQQVSE